MRAGRRSVRGGERGRGGARGRTRLEEVVEEAGADIERVRLNEEEGRYATSTGEGETEAGAEHEQSENDDLMAEAGTFEDDPARQEDWQLLRNFVTSMSQQEGKGPITESRLKYLAQITPSLTDAERQKALARVWEGAADEGAATAQRLRSFFRKQQAWIQKKLFNGKPTAELDVDFDGWVSALDEWREPALRFLSSDVGSLQRQMRFHVAADGDRKRGGMDQIVLTGLRGTKADLLKALAGSQLLPGADAEWSTRCIDSFLSNEFDSEGAANGKARVLISRDKGDSRDALAKLYFGRLRLFPAGWAEPSVSIFRSQHLFALEKISDDDLLQYLNVIEWLRRCGFQPHQILRLMEGQLQERVSDVAEIVPDYTQHAGRSITNVFHKIGSRVGRLAVLFASPAAEQAALSLGDPVIVFDFSAQFQGLSRREDISTPPPLKHGLSFRLRFKKVSQTTEREEESVASVVLRNMHQRDLLSKIGGRGELQQSRRVLEQTLQKCVQDFLLLHLPPDREDIIRAIEVEIDDTVPQWPILIHFMPAEGAAPDDDIRWVALQLAFVIGNRCTESHRGAHLFFDPVAAAGCEYTGRPNAHSCDLARVTFMGPDNKRLYASLAQRPSHTFTDGDVDSDRVLVDLCKSLLRHQLLLGRGLLLELATMDRNVRASGRGEDVVRKYKGASRDGWLPATNMAGFVLKTDSLQLADVPSFFSLLSSQFSGTPASTWPSCNDWSLDMQALADAVLTEVSPKLSIFSPPAVVITFQLSPGLFDKTAIRRGRAPVCTGCHRAMSDGYLAPDFGLKCCIRCYQSLVAVEVATKLTPCLQGVAGMLRGTPPSLAGPPSSKDVLL